MKDFLEVFGTLVVLVGGILMLLGTVTVLVFNAASAFPVLFTVLGISAVFIAGIGAYIVTIADKVK